MADESLIADTLEFRVWATRSGCTSSQLEDELEAALDTEQEDPDEIAEAVYDVIEDRVGALGDAYPFNFDGVRLSYKATGGDFPTYLFCLALCLLPAEDITNDLRTEEFETIVKRAAESYFNAQGVRVGAPAGEAFETILQRVQGLVPNVGAIIEPNAPGGGDCGWDVVVANNFCDNEWPRLVAMGNCATGRTDWLKKGQEASPNYFWERHFERPYLKGPLLTFFAVPFIFEDEEQRSRKRYDNGITFDRIRISEHAPTCAAVAAAWVRANRTFGQSLPLI